MAVIKKRSSQKKIISNNNSPIYQRLGIKGWLLVVVCILICAIVTSFRQIYDSSSLANMSSSPLLVLSSEPLIQQHQDKVPKAMSADTLLTKNITTQLQHSLPIDASTKVESTDTTNNNNPWYGWQPQPDNEDWGDAPVPPKDWIPDVTMLKSMHTNGHDKNGNVWPPSLDQRLCQPMIPDGNKEGDDNTDWTLRLIQEGPIQAQKPFSNDKDGAPKILCLMYTMEEFHSTLVRASRETWAPGCDGFLAFSTKSDPRIPAISVPHKGKEEYNNMWQKVRSIWKFVGEHYLEEFDWFHIGGDDMYVLTENLRTFLSDKNPNDDHFFGRRLLKPIGGGPNNYYNVGGPGYTLSRATAYKLVTKGLEHDKCMPSARRSSEDVWIAKCLRIVFNIWPEDTRDNEGKERYHHYSLADSYKMKPNDEDTKWYFDASKPWGIPDTGKHCCARDSVAFHYIKQPEMMRHIHKLLYNKC